MKKSSLGSVIVGAAFLMATSAVGPGFLTQTATFTRDLAASFGFVILISVVLDVFAQLNIWRVLTVSGRRGPEVAAATIPGSGHVLALLIVVGGIFFNIGNIGGCGLGLDAALGVPVGWGAALSALVAIGIFALPQAGRAMDAFVKVLGVVMLGLIAYVVFAARPPLGEAALRTVAPLEVSFRAIVTLVGGTVGGYITFAGAHRLIDAGVTGEGALAEVNRGAVSGIMLTALIRFMLFLAAFGVLRLGFGLGGPNPAAEVFSSAAGETGARLFGVVMWAASITSVVGAAYTSVSFVKALGPRFAAREQPLVIAFIAFSTLVFLFAGAAPKALLVLAGTVNGFILPIGLALVLLASGRREIVGEYLHPLWLKVTGWLVVAVMTGFSAMTVWELTR